MARDKDQVIIDDSWYVRSNGLKDRAAAGGVVVRRDGKNVLVLLGRSHGLGKYFLPKGGVEPGELVEKAARREIEEEVGVTDLTLLDDLGSLARANFTRTRWVTTHYFLYLTRQIEATPTDADRHPPPHWYPIDQLPEIFWPEQRRMIESNRDRIVSAAMANACD